MTVFIGTLVILFLISVLAIELVLYAIRTSRSTDPDKLRKRLRTETLVQSPDQPDIVRKKVYSSVPVLNAVLVRIPGIDRIDRLLRQANVQHPPGVFILATLVMILAGYLVTNLFTGQVYAAAAAVVAGMFPLLYVKQKKSSRMQRFQAQLPEGLELIARALRAGHAFTTGMKLAADNFGDPLGPEFEETIDEINFGVSIPDALKTLARRVDCPDLKFFVVSVILQRETGGNLAEIIESIARIIRERFKFQDKVRVLSAEGKLSARVLVALPFLVVVAVRFTNPNYTNVLLAETTGRIIAGVAVVLMAIGIYVMMKMVKIRV